MTEARVRIWDGSGGTREVSLAELRRYFTTPLETWEAIAIVVLFGDDPLVVYPIHDGQCPAVDRAADHGETTLDHARRFFLDATRSHRSPRYVDERDAVIARSWDEGACPFWVSSAFVWGAEEAFAIAARFGLDGTACDAIEGRALVWEDGWVAAGEGDSFGEWNVGIIRLDDVEVEAPDFEMVDQLPIDDSRLRWEEGTIAPRRTERGPIRLGFYVRGPLDPVLLRGFASTGTWSALSDLGMDQDAWLDALIARPMAALRHLGVGGTVDRTKLERAITAQPRLAYLSLRPETVEVPSLRSATLTQLFLHWRWTAREVTLLLERAELPRLEWLELSGCTCEGVDLSRLGPDVRVALLEATPGAIRAASGVASLWVRTIPFGQPHDEIEQALAERRAAGRRLLLPIAD